MLRLLTVDKDFLSMDNTVASYDAPRPLDLTKLEARCSISSIPSSQSSISRYSVDSHCSRRSSITSYSSECSYPSGFADHFEIPTLTKTPWEAGKSKRVWRVQRRPPSPTILPEHYFKNLPKEVYDCILIQLKSLHLTGNDESCLSCYMKDLYNLTLTSRMWDCVAREHLYGDIRLSSEDFQEIVRKRQKLPSRIKLLRRTLRKRARLANFVKILNMHGLQAVFDSSWGNERDELLSTVASLVMACPNLEALRGFSPPTDHHFDRLSHALATRKSLKERVFILNDEKPRLLRENYSKEERTLFYQYENPTETFLHQSDNWSYLETLFLHGQRPGCMNYRSFVGTFRNLPSLKHLVISSFDANDFNDRTLKALPRLKSLRLQNLPGLTDKGILRFSDSESAASIQNLALIDLEITHLHIIRHFFAKLNTLRRFTFHQGSSPCLMPGTALTKPIFASETLEYLHWDVLIPGNINDDLADSIFFGAFPALRTIRCPSDHHGMLQDLCRPLARATLDSDYHLLARVDSPFEDVLHSERALPAARRAAQERIEQARKNPFIRVIVEEEGMIKSVQTMKDFMGSLHSRIDYSLEPDVPGSEEALVSVQDLVRGAGVPKNQGLATCQRSGGDNEWHKARSPLPEASLRMFF